MFPESPIPLVPKLCLGIEPAGSGARWTKPAGERSGERESTHLSSKLRFAGVRTLKLGQLPPPSPLPCATLPSMSLLPVAPFCLPNTSQVTCHTSLSSIIRFGVSHWSLALRRSRQLPGCVTVYPCGSRAHITVLWALRLCHFGSAGSILLSYYERTSHQAASRR